MQISQTTSQPADIRDYAAAGYSFTEKIQTSQSHTNIEYSSDSLNLNLSVSTNSTYVETLYTENGVFDTSRFPAPMNGMSNSQNDPVSESISNSSQMIQEEINAFMEMISKQVEQLILKIAELQQKMLDSSGQDNQNTLPSAPHGSSLKGYSVYYQETLIQTLEISGNTTVSDSGYYSAENTAERIIQFALSFYDGGDRQEYAEMVRAAVMKGFNQAMGVSGGALPQISSDTIGLVNSALDTFAAGSNTGMVA